MAKVPQRAASDPTPGSMFDGFVAWAGAKAQDIADVKDAMGVAMRHAPEAAYDEVGEDLREVVDGIIPGLKLAAGIMAACIVGGAAVGGAAGALAGGVGAAPGAVVGAKTGLGIGIALLNILGIGALAVYVVEHLGECEQWLSKGMSTALAANGNAARIDAAGRQMAKGFGIFVSLIVQALIAYAAAKGLKAVTDLLRGSKLGGPAATTAVESAAFTRAAKIQGYLDGLGLPRAPVAVRQRVGVAVDFFEGTGASSKDVAGMLKGIDFSKPVEVVTVDPSMKLVQYSKGYLGNWFARSGTPMNRLGLAEGEAVPGAAAALRSAQASRNAAANTRLAERMVAQRQPVAGTVAPGTKALKSTAAPIRDFWTSGNQSGIQRNAATGRLEYTGDLRAGGGEQFFIPDKGAVSVPLNAQGMVQTRVMPFGPKK
jgi:hypothetical protein